MCNYQDIEAVDSKVTAPNNLPDPNVAALGRFTALHSSVALACLSPLPVLSLCPVDSLLLSMYS